MLVGDSAHAIHLIASLNLGFRDAAALAQVLVEGARLGLDLGDRQLMDRYQRWRSLDTLMVAMATDGLTRLYGIPGKLPSAVRRFGMAVTSRIGPLKDRLMNEARGTSGDLPLLLRACRSNYCSVWPMSAPPGRGAGTASAGRPNRRGPPGWLPRAGPAWRRCRTAPPGRWH